jgi:hypothetical protein
LDALIPPTPDSDTASPPSDEEDLTPITKPVRRQDAAVVSDNLAARLERISTADVRQDIA